MTDLVFAKVLRSARKCLEMKARETFNAFNDGNGGMMMDDQKKKQKKIEQY